MSIEDTIAKLADESRGGLESVYWTGCGQSLGALHPAHYLLRSESKRLGSFWENSSEFARALPSGIRPGSLVVANSHSGNTPEVVEAARGAKARGARAISLIYKDGSALADTSDGVVKYEWGPDKRIGYEKSACALRIAAEITVRSGGFPRYREFMEAMGVIDSVVRKAKASAEAALRGFAEANKDVGMYYVVGGGGATGAAYNEVIALLQSLWINSCLIPSGEFPHGPIEIVEKGTTFIVLAGGGRMRDADLKAYDFISGHTDRCLLIDAERLGLDAIDPTVRDYFSFALFNNVLEIFNRRLSELREHPLSTKRHMAQA